MGGWRSMPLTPEEESNIDRKARAYIAGVPPGPNIPPETVEKAVQDVIKVTREWTKIAKWRQRYGAGGDAGAAELQGRVQT